MNIQTDSRNLSEKLGVIDTDFHPMPFPTDPQVAKHLAPRWRDYLARYGGGNSYYRYTPTWRQWAHRLDAVDKNGRVGVDPDWCRQQALDPFDVSAVVLNCPDTLGSGGHGINAPVELSMAICRAYNDALAETWLGADPRYYGSITLPRDLPNVVDEIRRCKESSVGDRFVQVYMAPSGQEPIGRQRYWPIFEACCHYDIPIGFHVPGAGRQPTGCGAADFYSESHINYVALAMTMVPSLIFEGVFDRFPTLKIALIELGWSWAPTFSWRMDSAWSKLRHEVPHIQRPPSEYFKEHFWFCTQPLEEPEKPKQLEEVYQTFEECGFADRLMFSSDYPHWDTDSPYDAIPYSFPLDRRRRILGENASKLYKIPLIPGHGIPAYERAA
jgi:predicted TIM-barrel fold metal-dependent hydrolase